MTPRTEAGQSIVTTMKQKAGPLFMTFEAEPRQSPAKGGWSCVVWPESAALRLDIDKQAGQRVLVHLEERLG